MLAKVFNCLENLPSSRFYQEKGESVWTPRGGWGPVEVCWRPMSRADCPWEGEYDSMRRLTSCWQLIASLDWNWLRAQLLALTLMLSRDSRSLDLAMVSKPSAFDLSLNICKSIWKGLSSDWDGK
jgi:hypothetical protein